MTNEQKLPEFTAEEKAILKLVIERWERFHLAIIFICGLGRVIKWFVTLGAAVAAIWTAVHFGKAPP